MLDVDRPLRAQDLAELVLVPGGSSRRGDGVGLLEAVAWWVGGRHTAWPAGVSLLLCQFGNQLNDLLPDDRRQLLKPLIPELVGTEGDGFDEARRYLCLDWLVRCWAPAWLEATGFNELAGCLRDLPRIADKATSQRSLPTLQATLTAVLAALREAEAAATVAAADAAWQAADHAATEAIGSSGWAAISWAFPSKDEASDLVKASVRAAAHAHAWRAGPEALVQIVERLRLPLIEAYAAIVRPDPAAVIVPVRPDPPGVPLGEDWQAVLWDPHRLAATDLDGWNTIARMLVGELGEHLHAELVVEPVDRLTDEHERLWTMVYGHSLAGPLALTFEGPLIISTRWPEFPAVVNLFLFALGSRLVGLDPRHNHLELRYHREPAPVADNGGDSGRRGRWSQPYWWGPDEFGEWDDYTEPQTRQLT